MITGTCKFGLWYYIYLLPLTAAYFPNNINARVQQSSFSLIGSKNPARNIVEKPINSTQQVITSHSTGAKDGPVMRLETRQV